MKAVTSALPALVAALVGVCMYVHYLPGWTGAVVIAIGGVVTLLGRKLLSARPVLATYLFAGWILVGIGLIAYAGWAALWLALHIDRFLPASNAATMKEIGAAVSSSLATFLGFVLVKDFGEGKGAFWPGSYYRQQVQRIFGKGSLAPLPLTKAFEVVWNQRVANGGPDGWGYTARLERAKILGEHLKAIRTDATTPDLADTGRNEEAATFLAHVVWIVGGFVAFLCLKVWGAITTYTFVALVFLSDLAYSECLSASLWLLILPLAVVHAAMHLYQRFTVDAGRFPGQLTTLVIPHSLRWVRVVLFVALVVFPTFSYCFFVGRMFDHLTIAWYAEANARDPRVAPSSKTGVRLLTDWGWHSNRIFDGPFQSGWRWWAWQDYRRAYGTLDDKGQRTGKSPHAAVFPGLAPTVYSLFAVTLAVSLIFLILRRPQHPAPIP
jgi:hypothetical protein